MFFSGSYSFLKENLLNLIKNIEVGKKITFIVHSNQMKLYLKEYLVKNLGILVNTEFYTLIDISKRLSEIEPLNDFDKEFIIKKFLLEKNLDLDSLPEEFNLLLQQIKEYQIPIINIKSDFVKEIINKYENFKDKKYFDREDVHQKAIEKNTDFKTDYLIIFGIKSVPKLHQRLFLKLKSISQNIFVFLPLIKNSGYFQNYQHFKEVFNFYEDMIENQAIEEKSYDINTKTANLIYKNQYNFKPFKNENIRLLKAKNPYQEVEFLAYEIINLIEKGNDFKEIAVIIPQIESYIPYIKDIFNKYKIPYYLSEENRYIDYPVYRKLFDIFQLKQENFSKDFVLKILDSNLINIEDIDKVYKEILNLPVIISFEEWEEYFFKEKDNNLYKILKLINDFPEETDLESYINLLKNISNLIKSEELKQFLNEIIENLENNQLYKELFPKLRYKDFLAILKTFFMQEYKENKIRANTISILNPISAEGNNFKYIFFLNLNSGNFPSTIREEILATASELNNVDYPYHLLMQQLSSFASILDKDKKIYLSYVGNGINGEKKAPSFIIEELKRILNIEIEDVKIDKPLSKKDFYIKYAKYLINLDNNLKEKYQKIKEKDLEKTKQDFKYDFVNIQFPISATKFSIYATCPYKFFFEVLMEISDIEQIDREKISPVDKGIIIHKVLENFYKNKDWEELEKQFFKEIEEKIKFLIPSYIPFAYEDAKITFENLKKFIDWDLKRLKEEQKETIILEEAYETKDFKGKIDRVDKDNNENYYIYDYKTGKTKIKDIEEDIKTKYIQLLIYKRFLKDKKVKEIGIFSINNKNGDFLAKIDDENKLKELDSYLLSLLDQLKNKYFYPQENDYCKYCIFETFCPKDKLKEE